MNPTKVLLSEITEAFKDVELLDGIGLLEGNAIDDYKDEHYREECRKRDEKQQWNVIPSSFLNQCHSALSFLDAKSMRFHLPAFMMAQLKGEYHLDLVFTLTNLSEHSQTQFSLLSKRQKEGVRLFLEHFSDHPDYAFEKECIRSAIDIYWSK